MAKKTVAILVEKDYEDLELQYPRLRLQEAGFTVKVVGPKEGETYKGKNGYPQRADVAAKDVSANKFDAIVIPGGFSPDHMRRDEHMVRLVQEAAEAQIPLAAICHGPWMLCSTSALRNRRCTSFFAIVHDVVNAGGNWVDEQCVVDEHIITARTPDDLSAFVDAIIQMVNTGHANGAKGKPIAPQWVTKSLAQLEQAAR